MHDGAGCMPPTESWPFKDSQSPNIVIFEVVSDKLLLEYAGSNRILRIQRLSVGHNGDRPHFS